MSYCFNSHDVFGRAFKRLFGVTPNEYRSINRRMARLRKNINAREELGMYDLIIGQKLQCTNIEKRECLETLSRILELAALARKEGLLALEQDIARQESNFMKKALLLITEGYDPKSVRQILQNYILVGEYKGKALLERIIIMEGVLLIQAGIKPSMIKENLCSYFGEDFIPEAMKYFNDSFLPEEKLKAYYERIRETKSRFNGDSEDAAFEEAMLALSPRSIQRLLRDMDFDDLINVLSCAGGRLQMLLLDNMHKRLAVSMMNEIEDRAPVSKERLKISQKCLLHMIGKLKELGEIE